MPDETYTFDVAGIMKRANEIGKNEIGRPEANQIITDNAGLFVEGQKVSKDDLGGIITMYIHDFGVKPRS